MATRSHDALRRSFRTLTGALVLAVVLVAPVAGQDWRTPAGLDQYFLEAIDTWNVPGMAVGIVHDGQVVLTSGYGVLELGRPEPVDAHSLFAIASNSKAFTSAALAILVDEGKLSWDDRVQEFLPWFQVYDTWVSQEMRVRDLLSHRSGLGTFSGDLLWYGTEKHFTREDIIRRARFIPQAGPFRASYGYSNMMFIAAGLVIEAASGQSWESFIQERFLTPLGMNRTVVSVTQLPGTPNVASPHSDRDGTLHPYPWYNWDLMAPAGGIISSAFDMTRWMQLQLGQGTLDGETYFDARRSSDMWTVHNPFRVTAPTPGSEPTTHFRGYGLGWSLMDYRGRMVASHGGGYDGMFSRLALVPEAGLGVVILTNSMTGISGAMMNRVLDAYLGGGERDWSGEGAARARENPIPEHRIWPEWTAARVHGTTPSLPLDGYTGTFGGDMYGDAVVSMEDGGLVLRLVPNPELVADLTHWHHNTFRVKWRTPVTWFGDGLANFIVGLDGTPGEIRMDVPNGDLWFTELELIRREN